MSKPVARMYLKPVLGDADVRADPVKVLRRLKAELHKRIKVKIQETAFSPRAKQAFSKAVIIRIQPSSLLIMTKHPGFLPMLKGQQKGQMRWLTKASRPIPLITDQGELIFRWATPRSMQRGRWIHPGRAPTNFIDRAKKEARTFVKQHLTKEIRSQIVSALRGK